MQVRQESPQSFTPEQYINHVAARINLDLRKFHRKVSTTEVTQIPEDVVKALKAVIEHSGFDVVEFEDSPVSYNQNYKNPNNDPKWIKLTNPRKFITVRERIDAST